MIRRNRAQLNRRAFLGTTAAALGGLSASAVWAQASDPFGPEPVEKTRRNTAIFRAHDWRPFFGDLTNGAILVDTASRALHYWSEDASVMKVYPTSVPLSEDLTRRGRTEVVRKVEGPDWRPTPAMKQRNPEWPDYVGPGPDNPLGTHALYLGWTYYRIHGTHDTRKIGRKSSNGCIGLYNEHIAELFAMAKVGTQVLLI